MDSDTKSVLGSTASGAAAGAAIGSFIPGAGTLIGAGIGGLLGFGSSLAGNAAASGQQRMAQAQLEEARRTRELALQYAGPSASELQGQQQLLALQEQVLGRANRELDFLSRSLDLRSPGASQAGQGLFSQLISRQRAAQRAALESQLQQRLGAGYATSSIGQQALQSFDQGTVDIGVQAIPQFLQTAYGAINAPMAIDQQIANRRLAAITQTPVTQYAGAQYLGDILRGQQQQQMLGSLIKTGATVAGAAFGGPAGAFAANQLAPDLQMPTLGSQFSSQQPRWQQGNFGNFTY